jgi:beta-galactosidase GanA
MKPISILALALLALGAATPPDPALPHLRRQGTATQLIVKGRPFLVRGGETGNSSGEPGYLRAFWPKLEALKLNTLLVPVYWDTLEPREGLFDFAALDGLVSDARAHGMHLGLLWFGSWKNSMSCYAPAWVKADLARFPRARDRSGRAQEILSPFSEANRQFDAKAFAALMKHLRGMDEAAQTVVMIQVENEIGMIPSARDFSPDAEARFRQMVPAELMAVLRAGREADRLQPELRKIWESAGAKPGGTWSEVFGPGLAAEEVFMAWHFARYTEQVAAAGRAEYPLPMFVNAALIRPAFQPGQYPSAGPLPHLMDVWRAAAPSIDFLAPDIYFPNFAEWTARYAQAGNPLFVPEALRSPEAAVNALYAAGQHDAIGFCPFAIESIGEPAASLLAAANDTLAQLEPLLVANQGKGTMAGLLPPAAEQRQPHQIELGGLLLNVTYERGTPPALADGVIVPSGAASSAPPPPAGGLVIATGPDEYLFAGLGVIVTFDSRVAGEIVGIAGVEEGRFADGQWQHVRWLNGDQTHQGRHLRLEPGRFVIQRIRLYRYR